MNYEIVYDKIAYFTNVFENIDEVTNLIEEINSGKLNFVKDFNSK